MNRKVIHRTFFIIVAFTFSLAVMAQDYKNDMQKIREYYKNKYHSFKMKFEFYPYDSLSIIADSMKGKCFITGNSYYYKLNGVGNEYEYVKNTRHYMVIDHANRILALEESSKAQTQLWDMRKIDSLLSISAMKVVYKELGHNEGEYDILFTKGTWNRLTLVFNKERFTLDKIFMRSSEKGAMSGVSYNKPKIFISYTDYSEVMPDNSVFSDAKYIADAGNKIVPSEEYKGYKVLDCLKSK